jgi:hypothetical protein
MTSTETQSAPPELVNDFNALKELAQECWTTQALIRLLDYSKVTWQGLRAAGEHAVDIDGVLGVLDLNRRAFLPEEFELLTELLYGRLVAEVGDNPLLVDDAYVAVDWTSMQIVRDTPQPSASIRVTAESVPDDEGNAYRLVLDTDPEGGIEVAEFTRLGDTADDEDEDDDTDGTEAAGAGQAAEEDAGDEWGGITADYLGDYYGADPVPFENVGYVVDWTTWKPDQRADGGLIGSRMTGHDHDGREHELYVWFGAETGAEIVEAEPVAGDDPDGGGDAAQAAVFAEEVVPGWRQVCRDAGSVLVTEDDTRYDVSRWVDEANDDYLPELLDADGGAFLVSLRAATVGDEPREVRLRLVVEDLERVRVEQVEDV